MSRFESGVKRYIKGTATLTVFFPVDFRDREFISCEFCRLFSRSSGRCNWTSEIVPFPEKSVGYECPLEREETNEGNSVADGE